MIILKSESCHNSVEQKKKIMTLKMMITMITRPFQMKLPRSIYRVGKTFIKVVWFHSVTFKILTSFTLILSSKMWQIIHEHALKKKNFWQSFKDVQRRVNVRIFIFSCFCWEIFVFPKLKLVRLSCKSCKNSHRIKSRSTFWLFGQP